MLLGHFERVVAVVVVLTTSPCSGDEPSKIAQAIQPLVDRHELAGAVMLVASKDAILDNENVGLADINARLPMRPDTMFWIASMSKPIAATALMMLADENKVHLDDPVEHYLPGFRPRIMQADSTETHVNLVLPQHIITVRELLTHQSGLVGRSSLETKLDRFPLGLRVQSYVLEPLMYEPGTRTEYSNADINTAARIVEVISGMPFEEYLQRRLFDPLRMTDTTFWPTTAQLKRLAKSYKPRGTQGLEETAIDQLSYPLDDRSHRRPIPAGGLFSTAQDLARFCQMYLNGGILEGRRYLSEKAIVEMTRDAGRPAIANYEGYGLGWGTREHGVFGHSSASTSAMTIDPLHGLIMIWMVQDLGGAAGFDGQLAFESAALNVYRTLSTEPNSRP